MILNFQQDRIKLVSQLIQTIAVDLVLVILVDVLEIYWANAEKSMSKTTDF
jgi:hypothetical protein